MANDVDIIIGADSSKLQREVRDATQELDRLRTASERMTTSSVEMDRALAGAANPEEPSKATMSRRRALKTRTPVCGQKPAAGQFRYPQMISTQSSPCEHSPWPGA